MEVNNDINRGYLFIDFFQKDLEDTEKRCTFAQNGQNLTGMVRSSKKKK